MPDLDTIVDAQSGRCRGRHDEPTIWAPIAHTRVATLDGADLCEVFVKVIHINLASQVAKAGDEDEAAVGRKGNGVARRKSK